MLDVPNSIVNWIIDFLSNRSQRIKFGEGYVSEWESALLGVPQTLWSKMQVYGNMQMIPLSPKQSRKGNLTTPNVLQIVVQWSLENRVQLNNDKCKEMRISFTKSQQELERILINGDALKVVDSVKLLGLNISSDLTWNIHIKKNS